MAQKYQIKYGILFKPTNEYMSWFDNNMVKLFDTDRDAVVKARDTLFNFDKLHGMSEEDFVIDSVALPVEFDGSNLANDSLFISKQVIYNSL